MSSGFTTMAILAALQFILMVILDKCPGLHQVPAWDPTHPDQSYCGGWGAQKFSGLKDESKGVSYQHLTLPTKSIV